MKGIPAIFFDAVEQFDGAADAHAFVLALEQPFQGVNIILRVKPVPTGRALGDRNAIAPLPGPQCVWLETCFAHHRFQVIGWRFVVHALASFQLGITLTRLSISDKYITSCKWLSIICIENIADELDFVGQKCR